jgi:hypothetical protein
MNDDILRAPGGELPEPEWYDESDPAFDFPHYLYNTVLLLGGKKEIAELLKKWLDGKITREDARAVVRYNSELQDNIKLRIVHCDKITVRVKPEPEEQSEEDSGWKL